MLPVQESLAESVEAEDVRSEDGERGHYYCLYRYLPAAGGAAHEEEDEGSAEPGEEHSLSLLDTNLPPELEPELRIFLSRRLSRGSVFEGMGNVASVDLGSPDYTLGCYYHLMHSDAEEPGDHIVCFLGGSEKGLDLFRLELDSYVEGLRSKLEPQIGDLQSELGPYLGSWFEDSVLPIQRVVLLFQEKLTYLLHAALSYTPVQVINASERTHNDIHRFLRSAGLQGLVQEETATSLCTDQQRSLTVDLREGEGQPLLQDAVSNRFCEDWAQVFLSAGDAGSPFLFRQKLENFKLKVIQDMNILKRLIRQAESSHYSLYRCYGFLRGCGHGDLLLRVVRVETAGMEEARSVVAVLEEVIAEEAARGS